MSIPASAPAPAAAWWKTAVAYRIYPRSFQDANGDDVGDLAGIVREMRAITEAYPDGC